MKVFAFICVVSMANLKAVHTIMLVFLIMNLPIFVLGWFPMVSNFIVLPSSKALAFGHSSVGTVTFQSAAYVARYIMKKVTGRLPNGIICFVDPLTGEIFDRRAEFTQMSLKPGLGKGWFDKYHSDVFLVMRLLLMVKRFVLLVITIVNMKFYILTKWMKLGNNVLLRL